MRPDGAFSFPLVGEVDARGKSVAELNKIVSERLARYIADAVVTISVQQINGNKIYVLGQVNKPGEFIVNPSVNIMQALSMAGGMTPFAATNDIIVLRGQGKQQNAMAFRYNDVVRGRSLDTNIELLSGRHRCCAVKEKRTVTGCGRKQKRVVCLRIRERGTRKAWRARLATPADGRDHRLRRKLGVRAARARADTGTTTTIGWICRAASSKSPAPRRMSARPCVRSIRARILKSHRVYVRPTFRVKATKTRPTIFCAACSGRHAAAPHGRAGLTSRIRTSCAASLPGTDFEGDLGDPQGVDSGRTVERNRRDLIRVAPYFHVRLHGALFACELAARYVDAQYDRQIRTRSRTSANSASRPAVAFRCRSETRSWFRALASQYETSFDTDGLWRGGQVDD